MDDDAIGCSPYYVDLAIGVLRQAVMDHAWTWLYSEGAAVYIGLCGMEPETFTRRLDAERRRGRIRVMWQREEDGHAQ